MPTVRSLLRFGFVFSALAVVGCASATGPLAPPRTGDAGAAPLGAAAPSAPLRTSFAPRGTGWISPAAKGQALLFLSDEGVNAVLIYAQNALHGAAIGQITDGIDVPDGMCVDPKGNLYVTNAGANTVTMYRAGEIHPAKTYTAGMSTPVNIAVGKDGALYVVDINHGAAYVDVYPPGSMTPSLTITGPTGLAAGVAVDDHNRVFVSYHDSTGHGWVYRYPKGSTTGTNLGLATHTPAGLALDASENLVAADEGLPSAIEVFPPGATQPSQVLTDGIGNPFLIALDRKQKRLFATDEYNVGIDVVAYPNLAFRFRMTQGIEVAAGVALTPPTRI
jgi:hypothetical protein